MLRCRNTTQTSVVLEWDPIYLASAELRSLSLYRNGTKAGVIPRDKLSTKVSGLALDTEYTFHLVLRTSAGQYSSERLTIKTHKMTDLTGITISPGVMPSQLKESLAETVNKIGAKLIDTVRIDTTHFVCTEPRGQAWEKAVEMNVPVVVPDWLKGCDREGRIVGVRSYYLDADPKQRQIGPSQTQASRLSVSGQVQARESPRIEHTPPTPERSTAEQSPNGRPSTATEPPTPPPKTVEERMAEDNAEPDRGTVAGATVSETPMGHDEEEEEEDDEGEESDDTEKPPPTSEDKGKGKMPHDIPEDENETSEREAANVAEEDGKFDEVAL